MVIKKAFTIIELLIVIVIIGILAAVIISSYTSVSQRATVASLQSDLSNASQQLKIYFADKGYYPTTIACPAVLNTDICLKSTGSTSLVYTSVNSSKPTFSLVATNGSLKYQVSTYTTPNSIPSPITDGLVLNLDASNPSSYTNGSTSWNDISGSANNATLASTSYDSTFSGSLLYNGSTSVAATAVSNSFNLSQATFAFWVKTPPNFGTWYRAFISKQGADRDFNLYAYSPDQTVDITRLHYSSTRLGVSSNVILPEAYAPNSWHHVALTISTSGTTSYYSDGVKVGSFAGISGSANSSYPVWIGKADNTWNGNIAVAQIYNRALSDNEILQSYNALRGRYGV